MSAPQVIVFPRGQLSTEDRASLQAAGFCAVEADDPKAVVTHLPSAPLATANEMLFCALKAMSDGSSITERARFTANLFEAVSKARAS